MAGRGLGGGATMRNAMLTSRVGRAGNNDSDEEDELAMTTVFSDVSKTPQPQSKKFLSSVTEGPQTPSGARLSQQTALSANEPSPSQPRMRLAVHIKSSPITPFTPINASSTHGSSTFTSRLGQLRGRTATSQTPVRPPTPDRIAGLRVSAEASARAPSSEPKKRGRPKGWKPGTPYTTDPNSRYRKREMKAAGSQVRRQSTDRGRDDKGKDRGQNQEAKRRGRPPRPPEPSIREKYLQSKPDYIPYKCEWALSVSDDSPAREPSICPAELQNMDSLRRHVFIVHGDEEQLGCRFPRCRDRDPPLRFKTEHEFEHHMETRHFRGLLWHLGEGYQNNGIETLRDRAGELPAYLFDKDRRQQVTPSVVDQRVESDFQRKERKRRLRRLLFQQNENAPSEEEWRQQMLGLA